MSCKNPLYQLLYYDKQGNFLRRRFPKGFSRKEWEEFVPSRHDPHDPLGCNDGEVCFKTLIGCGQCMSCRQDYAHEWANRLCLEALDQGSERSFFITLTYDPEYLPKSDIPLIDRETFQPVFTGSLQMDDVSAFIKRLRARLGQPGLRYYVSGEYGDNTRRPHYHLILFCDLYDLKSTRVLTDKTVRLPPNVFYSQTIDEAWGKGLCDVSYASAYTMSYTAGYVEKKLRGLHEDQYQKFCDECAFPGVGRQEKETARMSRRPGIGAPWFLKHGDEVRDGFLYLPTPSGCVKAPLPRIADALVDGEDLMRWKIEKQLYARDEFAKHHADLMRAHPGEKNQRYLEENEELIKEHARLADPRCKIRRQNVF